MLVDNIANRDVGGALSAVLLAYDFIGVGALRTQPLVQPQKRRSCRRILITQALHELDGK